MTPVEWLENLLHGIDLMWVWIVLSWLVLGLLAIAACVRSSQLSRALRSEKVRARGWQVAWQNESRRQQAQANSAGPQVTARTLIEDEQEPFSFYCQCPQCGGGMDIVLTDREKSAEEIKAETPMENPPHEDA